MARHSRSARVHASPASRASPKSTQSTPTRHPQNASSPYNGLLTPHSMGSMFPSPQFSMPRSMDASYTSPGHLQPTMYSAAQTVNKASVSTLHSPQFDARSIYFEAEKSVRTCFIIQSFPLYTALRLHFTNHLRMNHSVLLVCVNDDPYLPVSGDSSLRIHGFWLRYLHRW